MGKESVTCRGVTGSNGLLDLRPRCVHLLDFYARHICPEPTSWSNIRMSTSAVGTRTGCLSLMDLVDISADLQLYILDTEERSSAIN